VRKFQLLVSVTKYQYLLRKSGQECNLLLALGMEVNPAYRTSYLIEADVIKSFKTGPRDCANSMVWYEKILLPSHEDVFPLRIILETEIWPLGLFGQRSPGWEATPMLHIDLLIRTPFSVTCLKGIFCADYFAFEIGGKRGMIIREAYRSTSISLFIAYYIARFSDLGFVSSRKGKIPSCQRI
jgi:hypothetical protein